LIASGFSRRFGFLRKDYLILQEIGGAKPLNIWIEENILQRSISWSEKKRIIENFAHFVRTVHDEGIYPKDFHPGNILIKTEKDKPPVFYLIDLHSIRIKKKVSFREREKNLTQLNDFRMSLTDRMRFLKSYFQVEWLNGLPIKDIAKEIGLASMKHWKHLWKKRKRKCLRERKEYEWWEIGSWKGMVRSDCVSDFSQILKKFESNFTGAEIKNIKKSFRTSVKEMYIPQQSKDYSFIIKEFKTAGFMSKVKALFRNSRLRRAWINAHNLIMRGILTPVPVAFGEKKRFRIIQEGFFMTKKIPEAQASDVFLKEITKDLNDSEKASIIKDFLIRLARLIRWMHQTGICHGDLKASNILINTPKKRPAIYLVDMDGVKIRDRVGVKEVARDLSRIIAAFSGILSTSEETYFLRIYQRGNRFFQKHEKRIMGRVRKLAAKKIQQKQKIVR
jgi:tRNA A-37 threonylcarbamoyl transferase component Bud32